MYVVLYTCVQYITYIIYVLVIMYKCVFVQIVSTVLLLPYLQLRSTNIFK